MKKWQAWFLHFANLAAGMTGLVYAYFIYLGEPLDEFSNISSTWQPLVHELHILAAPLLIFGCGMIWLTHAWTKFKSGAPARRRTGIILLLSAWPMILSGVVIQVVTEPAASRFWKVSHLATSLIWLGIYVLHQLQKRAR